MISSARTYTFILLLGAALIVSLAACDSNGGGDGGEETPNASFSLSISGDGVNQSLDGFAYFGEAEDPETGEEAFVIFLSEEENINQQGTYSYAIIGRSSSRPGDGPYDFADLDSDDDIPNSAFVGWVAIVSGEQITDIYFSNSGGSLDITSSSSSRVEGSFSIDATGFSISDPEEEVDVTIEGSFDARSNNVFLPPSF